MSEARTIQFGDYTAELTEFGWRISDKVVMSMAMDREVALIEALSTARADALRLDKLESYGSVVAGLPPTLRVSEAVFGWRKDYRTLREAIDAALSKEQKK